MVVVAQSLSEIDAAYREHGSALLAYLRHRAGVAAADLLQETFVQAIRGADRLSQAVSPRAWLFGIARHVAMSARRRPRRHVPLPADVAAKAEPAADPRIDAMRGAMARLPEEQREALEFRLRDELSYEEIAQVMNT